MERYVAEKVVKIKRFSEKWEKIFEQDPEGIEYEKTRHDYTISWEEREAAEKVNIKTLGRRNEILFDKWTKILKNDSNENEYNKLLNNKDASWIEKVAAQRAKRTINYENKKRRVEKFKTICKITPYDWWKILFRSMLGVSTVFFIIWFFLFCVNSPSDVPYGIRIMQLAVATMLSFAACGGVHFIIYAIIKLSGLDDYISEKRKTKNLKLFIQKHPNDIDIEFLQERLNGMTS